MFHACEYVQVRPKVKIPSKDSLKELAGMFGPASLIYIFKSLCYMLLQVSTALKSSVTHVRLMVLVMKVQSA